MSTGSIGAGERQMQWHDLLGAVLVDFFEGSPYTVQTEVDLSLKKQLLDILVIRKGQGELDRPLPDGMAPLASHNLISFKSHRDTFDTWSMLELIAYYVNYRKQASADPDDLLPEAEFRLFGIVARFPESLAKQIALEEQQPGVYDILIGATRIRLLVIRNLADEPANAVLKLFSVVPKQVEFACRTYRPLHEHLTGIVMEMIRIYRKEDKAMAITLAELNRKARKETIAEASVEERLDGLSAEERLKGLPTEEILKGLPVEERLKGLPAEEIERYLRALKDAKK
jgi:hypothetical protein